MIGSCGLPGSCANHYTYFLSCPFLFCSFSLYFCSFFYRLVRWLFRFLTPLFGRCASHYTYFLFCLIFFALSLSLLFYRLVRLLFRFCRLQSTCYTRRFSYVCVCQPPSLGILPSYFTAGGSDRVCGITANEDVHILWRSIGRRPDVYLLLSFGLFVVNNTVLGLSRLTVPHRAISKALVWYCSN